MKNKFILCVVLMLVAIYLCGCGTLTSSIVTNADDSIEESVVVTLDTEKLLEYGYSTNKILMLKNDIEAKATFVATEYQQNLITKANVDIMNTADEDTKEVLNGYKTGLKIETNEWDDMTYTMTIKFASTDVYKYFYNIKDDTSVEAEQEKHFWYTKYIYSGHTLYYKHSSLYDDFKTFISIKYPELITMNEGEMYYTTSVELRRQHSDADSIVYQDGMYYHTWKVTDKNQEIHFYYVVANRATWIALAVGVSVIVLAVLGTISLIKQKKNR